MVLASRLNTCGSIVHPLRCTQHAIAQVGAPSFYVPHLRRHTKRIAKTKRSNESASTKLRLRLMSGVRIANTINFCLLPHDHSSTSLIQTLWGRLSGRVLTCSSCWMKLVVMDEGCGGSPALNAKHECRGASSITECKDMGGMSTP